MTMNKQKFHHGDLVRILKNTNESRAHFTSDCRAIVLYSDIERHCGSRENPVQYGIYLENKGECAWYRECHMKLIAAKQYDLLEAWKADEGVQQALHSDLDWIFDHGKEVLKEAHGATVAALAACFGLTNLWGSGGEGFTYYVNAMNTLERARPFLEANDKDGWLIACTLQRSEQD